MKAQSEMLPKLVPPMPCLDRNSVLRPWYSPFGVPVFADIAPEHFFRAFNLVLRAPAAEVRPRLTASGSGRPLNIFMGAT